MRYLKILTRKDSPGELQCIHLSQAFTFIALSQCVRSMENNYDHLI
jgi:hypothetical protein